MKAVDILQSLIRFKTLSDNPHELRQCLNYISDLFKKAGSVPEIFWKNPDKPILYLRIRGNNPKALFFFGHIDVVPVENQEWKLPPFEGCVYDEYLYGRGAIDMKGPVSMMIAALLKILSSDRPPAHDIIFVLASDEETGGLEGCKFLAEEKPDLFKDVWYGISEFGAFSMIIGSRKFYPIQVKCKQVGILTISITGESGHTAIVRGTAFQKLRKTLCRLENYKRKPLITSIVKHMFTVIADSQQGIARLLFKLLLKPFFTGIILKLFKEQAVYFKELFYNNLTLCHIKTIGTEFMLPEKIELGFMYRLLPGVDESRFIDELINQLGKDVHLENYTGLSVKEEVDFGLFNTLSEIISEIDPEGISIPMLMPAATDSMWFERIGIQTYGFTPIISNNYQFLQNLHAADESIPLTALKTGTDAYYNLITGTFND